MSKPTARRPPPRSMLPPLPSSDIHAFAALPSACGTILQPISFNAARPPEDKDTILPSKLPPPGRSSADESALAAVVITFRPIEAARTVREPPPREDRDSAGRLLRPTGQTLSRVGSSSGFKSYAMDKILRLVHLLRAGAMDTSVCPCEAPRQVFEGRRCYITHTLMLSNMTPTADHQMGEM